MRSDLLDLVCCPACNGRLYLEPTESAGPEVITGRLACKDCGQHYPIERRMPLLYVNDELWISKAREAQGWVGIHKKRNIYEQPQDAIDLKIPYYPEEPWIEVARHFGVALDLMKLTGSETILDLGAGRGWAAKQFALKGCRTVAIDVASDEQVGLGRAWALMEQAGVRFELVIGDGENLPLFSNKFDFVFCAGVLHHTSNLPGLLKGVYKVLKPGGRLIAVGEPCIGINQNQQAILKLEAAEELAFGINEIRPNYLEYFDALKSAKFTNISICSIEFFVMSDSELRSWAMSCGAIVPLPGKLSVSRWKDAFLKFLDWHVRAKTPD